MSAALVDTTMVAPYNRIHFMPLFRWACLDLVFDAPRVDKISPALQRAEQQAPSRRKTWPSPGEDVLFQSADQQA
ncbi:MAG TPA: hypothetical protein DCZ69_13470 [Syntrophobacteraceae bacterium]|nr:hypothetical protein [Syntrophobacteraceae bacterium]